jgi:uncharacterized OB-fold protein
MSNRPIPVPDETSAAYWAACARHELTLPRCSQCGEFTLPPDISCPNCHSLDPRFTFARVSGRGKVRTWTIIRQSFLTGFPVPFVLVDVEFEDEPQIRMIGRLLDGPEAAIALGDPVTVVFEDLAPGIAVPAFVLEARS